MLAATVAAQPAQGQSYKFKILHTFHGNDGAAPVGQLARDKSGNVYGTAIIGGIGKCQGGCGTVFKLSGSGTLLWSHRFAGTNGQEPYAGLFRDSSGNLFGTTVYGGKVNNHLCPDLYGCGLVFKLDQAGAETVLHKFVGSPNGYLPNGPLVQDAAGSSYGTTSEGGQGYGVVFKINGTGEESVLYNFTGGSDGCFPDAGVILDGAGNLYGVTRQGGSDFCNSGYGVVFKLDTTGNETVLHTFGGGDGAYPESVLLFDTHGNLYGTTTAGGGSGDCFKGCGVVFELSPRNGDWTEAVLYSFCPASGCTDGDTPIAGPLVRDSKGNLYGTTYFGGAHANCNGGEGCGVVFKLDTASTETVLHSFTGGADGAAPWGGLTSDSMGNLYGAASQGGDLKCQPGNGQGCGTVFKIFQ
jgi:uncharacterized repeat protein (TIGR03803 family)